jgi:uncharacterized protein (UPF0332 family)
MSFPWKEYLSLAQELSRRTEEACHRSAISRAYYAAFHAARAYVREHHPAEHLPGGPEDHGRVWRILETSGRLGSRMGRLGKDLRRWRNQADYETSVAGLPRLVERAVVDAGEILRWLGTTS